MNMPLLKVKEYDEDLQIMKIREELSEVELERVMRNKDAELSELLDLITATFTKITHDYEQEQIKKGIEIHCNKLKSRGWETKGTIKIELEEENA